MSQPADPRVPSRKALERWYREKTRLYPELLDRFQERVRGLLAGAPGHPTVKARLKTFDSFYRKHLRRVRQAGANPKEIAHHDLLGLRVVCPFLEDLNAVEGILGEHLEVLEKEYKGDGQTFREFGYKSTHLLVRVPADIAREAAPGKAPVCEIQLRTLLQDAWAEVEHELVYKAEFTPFDEALRRKLAALNANLTLSDIIFQEIRDYQNQLHAQLEQRRKLFLEKVRESTEEEPGDGDGPESGAPAAGERRPVNPRPLMDDGLRNDADQLLLEALYAHNAREFRRAIELYTRILDGGPPASVRSIIHVHRGMAWFAESNLDEADRDFNRALEQDPSNFRAWYLRGTVRAARKEHRRALEDFTESLRLNPFQHDTLLGRARTCWGMGDYAEALADCRRLLSLFPDSREARRLLRQVRARLKR